MTYEEYLQHADECERLADTPARQTKGRHPHHKAYGWLQP